MQATTAMPSMIPSAHVCRLLYIWVGSMQTVHAVSAAVCLD